MLPVFLSETNNISVNFSTACLQVLNFQDGTGLQSTLADGVFGLRSIICNLIWEDRLESRSEGTPLMSLFFSFLAESTVSML